MVRVHVLLVGDEEFDSVGTDAEAMASAPSMLMQAKDCSSNRKLLQTLETSHWTKKPNPYAWEPPGLNRIMSCLILVPVGF